MNEAEVERFLRERRAGVGGVVALAHGEWSEAFAFVDGNEAYVARFSATDEDFEKDRLAGVAYASRMLPIPAILEIGPAPTGYFAVSRRVLGRPLDDCNRAEMRVRLPGLLATLDATRVADISGTRGYGRWDSASRAPFDSWQDFLLDVENGPAPTSRIVGWKEKLASSPVGMRAFDLGYERLREVAAAVPDTRYLVHADLLNGNVLVAGDRIAAVLDWGNALYGDFLYDLAWFCFWSPWYPQWDGIAFAGEALRHYERVGLDVPQFEERMLACQLHIALDGLAYSAFKGGWAEVERKAARMIEVASLG